MNREVRIRRNPYLWITTISFSLVVVSLGFLVTACGGSSTAPSVVSSVTVTGTPPAVGASSQYSATATMSNGTTEVVTTSATWTSSNPDIATVSPGGLVTALAEGTVTIQATFDNISGTAQAAVGAPAASLP
jgi:uncharacterized protein YjdB